MAITQLFPDRYSSLENTVQNSYMPKPSKLVASAMLATQLLSASTASAEQLGEVGLKIGRKVREVVSIGPTQNPSIKVQPAPQNDWQIDKADITIYDAQGKELHPYKKLAEGSIVKVPENGRVQVLYPTVAVNTKTKATLPLDILIKNPNGHYEKNLRPMTKNRTERAFNLDFEVEDAGLKVWSGNSTTYTMYLTAETSNTTDSILASTHYKLEVYKENKPTTTPSPQPQATPPVIVIVPMPVPKGPKHHEKSTEEHEKQKTPDGENTSRIIGAAAFLTGYQKHAVTLDPQSRQNGFVGRVLFDNPKFHFAGGIRFTQDSSYNPENGKLSSIESSANGDYRVIGNKNIGLIASGEIGRSEHSVKSDNASRTILNQGFPNSKTFVFNGGGGIALGENIGTSARLTYELTKAVQEGGFYLFPYGDIALNSRELGGHTVKAHLFIDGKTKPSVEAIYSQMNLQTDAKDVDVTSRSMTGRIYIPFGKEKKLNFTLGGNVAKFEDRGPGNHRGYFDRWYAEFGVAYKNRK
jgi:hypothetical protein